MMHSPTRCTTAEVGLGEHRRPVELDGGVVVLGPEDAERVDRLERLGAVGDGAVEEAQQGHVLPPVQRVAHEQHPLAPQHLQHHRRVEAAPQ